MTETAKLNGDMLTIFKLLECLVVIHKLNQLGKGVLLKYCTLLRVGTEKTWRDFLETDTYAEPFACFININQFQGQKRGLLVAKRGVPPVARRTWSNRLPTFHQQLFLNPKRGYLAAKKRATPIAGRTWNSLLPISHQQFSCISKESVTRGNNECTPHRWTSIEQPLAWFHTQLF